ncbi:hypothetical protein SAMN05216548_102157 [Faunimonas pinastri]|uniref:Uncharacterized protein n=1 Tax=Faunimonas pinastri TaxID=1855383 RepID=A0A1H9CHP0_9HYPH|nr:hypothetical protein [Faunimonas pinastri]SEQ00750.1 hypothetical protein SAMN05216548_102157 [Faunimonas pinastri]
MLTDSQTFGFSPAIEYASDDAAGARAPKGRTLSADFRLAGLRLTARELIGYVRVHATRARRRALPAAQISLEVRTPEGAPALQILFDL